MKPIKEAWATRPSKFKRWSATAAVLLLVIGCGRDESDEVLTHKALSERGIVAVAGSERYPFDTVGDQRAFTDAWVAAKVVSEAVGEIEGDGDREGYQQRSVRLRVEGTLWQRPDVEVPEQIEFETGLIVSDHEASYAVGEGGVPVVVGQRYLVGLIRTSEGTLDLANPRSIKDLDQRDQVIVEGDPTPAETFVEQIVDADPSVPDEIVDPAERLEIWHASH